MCCQIDEDDGQRLPGRATAENCASTSSTKVGYFFIWKIDRFKLVLRSVKRGQMPIALHAVSTNDPIFGLERIRRHPKYPLRKAEFGGHLKKRFYAVIPEAVKIPPAGSVRYKMENSTRRPFGLKDRLIFSAGYEPRGANSSGFIQVTDPQLGSVPRHIRMIPGQPGKLFSVRTGTRR